MGYVGRVHDYACMDHLALLGLKVDTCALLGGLAVAPISHGTVQLKAWRGGGPDEDTVRGHHK